MPSNTYAYMLMRRLAEEQRQAAREERRRRREQALNELSTPTPAPMPSPPPQQPVNRLRDLVSEFISDEIYNEVLQEYVPPVRPNLAGNVTFTTGGVNYYTLDMSDYNGYRATIADHTIQPRRSSMTNLDWISVKSSAIASIAYKSSSKVLFVLFKKGEVYKYENVSSYKFNKLTEAESKGRYLNQSIISDPATHKATLLTKDN